MSDCRYLSRVGLFHDQELDADRCRELQRHLQACDVCTAELAALRKISGLIHARDAEWANGRQMARLHQTLDAAARQERASRTLIRSSLSWAALAASVLIVSGVWLADSQPAQQSTMVSGSSAMAPAPEWQMVAMTLHADPRQGVTDDSPLSPRYAAAIQWMLDNLTEQKPWAKPS